MRKNYVQNRIFLLFIFFICEVVLIFQVNSFYENEKKLVLKQNIQNVESQFKIISKSLIDLSDSIFKGFIEREDILEAMENRDRFKIYKYLEKDFDYLKSLGIYRLNFYLPNNRSFLKMDDKNSFGDNAGLFKSTVKYTNEFKKPAKGYEIAGDLAIRNIYPLFYKDKYLGCVELSYGIGKLENELEKIYKVDSHFIVEKKKFNEKILSLHKDKYEDSFESEDFVEFKNKHSNDFFKGLTLSKEIREAIQRGIAQEKSFSLELNLSENLVSPYDYAASFILVPSYKSDTKMYFVIYSKNRDLKAFEEMKKDKKIILSIILIALFLFLYQLMKNNELTVKVKDEIEKERKKYKNLMNLASNGIHILDKDGNVYEANKSFANMLGYTRMEVLKLNLDDFDKKFYKKENFHTIINSNKYLIPNTLERMALPLMCKLQ